MALYALRVEKCLNVLDLVRQIDDVFFKIKTRIVLVSSLRSMIALSCRADERLASSAPRSGT